MKNASLLMSVVCPVFNEEKNIVPFVNRLDAVMKKIAACYELIFVLDPSIDRTEEVILKQRESNPSIKCIRFSRRFGQPAATMAGLYYAKGEAVIIIDVDLQDPPELIEEFVKKWKEGFKVVYAQRRTREGETFIKKMVAFFGYWMINKITKIKIPRNTGDFRLLDQEVVQHLIKLDDKDGFLRGLVAYVGFSQSAILYDRDARFAGVGNYNRYLGSLTIGLNGIIGFSRYPLHLISILGLMIAGGSFFLGLIYFCLKIFHVEIVWGNPTLVILISFFSGVQMLSLGVIGQYLARMYDSILNRPNFIIEKKYGFED